MLGSIHILHRQLIELSHRRKLLAFLFILPLLLMVLFGALLSGQPVPIVPSASKTPAIQELQNDKNLAAIYALYKADNKNGNLTVPSQILVSAYQSPINASIEYLVYALPGPENTTVIIVNNATAKYQSAVLAPNGRILKTTSGPLPAISDLTSLPQVSIQPLTNDQTALKLAQAAVEIFGVGLSIELGPQQRLIDLLFPEIVGLEIGWVGVLGAAVTSVEDRISGARRRILMTPVSRFSFVLGSALGNFLLIALQLIVLFATGIFVFHVNVAGSIYDLIPVVSAASFAVIGIGLTISHFSKTPDEAFYFSALINLPSGFLSSQYIPLIHTPISTLVTSLFPMTYANRALSAIIVNGASFLSVLPDLLTLAAFGVGLYFFGAIMVMHER
jgi:hypothetical protein